LQLRFADVQGFQRLSEVVPSCLAAACPALRTLLLRSCAFQEPPQPATSGVQTRQRKRLLLQQLMQRQTQTPLAVPPPLQVLHVVNVAGLTLRLLTAALASLPHLNSLTLGYGAAHPNSSDTLCQVLPAVAGQLTHLSLPGDSASVTTAVTKLLECPDIPSSIRQLRHIDLPDATLDDAGLSAVTTHLPLLTHVTVQSFELTTSHADAATCSWEELCVTRSLTVSSLTRLPLRGIRKLEVCSIRSAITTAAELSAALDAAPDCVFSCSPGIDDSNLELWCDADVWPVLLPRWRTGAARRLVIGASGADCLTPAALGALVSLLERLKSFEELSIGGFAHPGTDSAPLLLPALRNTSVDTLQLRYQQMTEEQLLAWCAGGKPGRHMIVLWECGTLQGSLTNVHKVLRQSGGDVSLEYYDVVDDDYYLLASKGDEGNWPGGYW
jgi:hypothetical protein